VAFCRLERKKKVEAVSAFATMREQPAHALRISANARAHRLLREAAVVGAAAKLSDRYRPRTTP
jgi:hypothetical protein